MTDPRASAGPGAQEPGEDAPGADRMGEDHPGAPVAPATRARHLVWQPEAPTEPMPLVQALRHTPYRQPKQMETPEDDADVQVALDLAVRVGELLLRCGGSSRDVEASVIAVAAAAGLNHLEVDVTNQSLLVQGMKAHGRPHTVLRVVRSTRRDFSRLVAVHRLVEDLVGGRIGREDAAGRVESIATSHRLAPLGAGLPAVGLSLVSAFVVDQIGRFFARIGLPAFYLAAIGATVATMFAW